MYDTGGLPVGFTGLVKLDLQAVKLIFCWKTHFTAFKNSFTGGCKIDRKTSTDSGYNFTHCKRGCIGYNPPQKSQTEATNVKLVNKTNFILAGPTDTSGQRGNALVGLANIKLVRETNLLLATSNQPYRGGCKQYNPFGSDTCSTKSHNFTGEQV
jgi:hypothetical protein